MPGIIVGCNGRDIAPPGAVPTTTEDSAGVVVVRSPFPAWRAGSGWTVDSLPDVEIGRESGPQEFLLSGVTSIVMFDGGPIVIGNRGYARRAPGPEGVINSSPRGRGDHTIRYFNLDGRVAAIAGGVGDAPHELRQLGGLYRVGEEVWAMQRFPHPMKVFSRTGSSVRSADLSASIGRLAVAIGTIGEGALAISETVTGVPQPRPGELGLHLKRVLTLSRSGELDSLLVVPYLQHVGQKEGGSALQAYGAVNVTRAGRRAIYTSWSADPPVQVLDASGKTTRIIRWNADRHAVTEDDKAAYRRQLLKTAPSLPPPVRARREYQATTMAFPEHHPVLTWIIEDDAGNLWVQRQPRPHRGTAGVSNDDRLSPTQWDVFDPRGAWLAPVSVPAGLKPQLIGKDHVVGVWQDENGVEYVRMHGIRRNAQP